MNLNETLIFVRVVQLGSFNKAAKMLEMPNSTVSAKISHLETRLGVTLLHRTTRKLNLTELGEVFYNNALKHIEGLESAELMATSHQKEPSGKLKIITPPLLASSVLPDIISNYIQKYPKVQLEIISTLDPLDLISENIDLAIRVGKLTDSSLKTRRIGVTVFAPFASPSYLKSHPKISHPKDLIKHLCIQFSNLGKDHWEFINKNKSRISISMDNKILFSELNVVKEIALRGQGVALLPTFACCKEIEKGNLKRLLPDWYSEAREMSFVYPAHKYMPPKLSAFIDLAYGPIQKILNDLEYKS